MFKTISFLMTITLLEPGFAIKKSVSTPIF